MTAGMRIGSLALFRANQLLNLASDLSSSFSRSFERRNIQNTSFRCVKWQVRRRVWRGASKQLPQRRIRNGTIMYTLSGIDKWYDENIGAISSNGYVCNLASHQKNMRLIKEILSGLREDECVPTTPEGIDAPKTDPVIFISHKSDDKKYGDALERFITGLGVKDNQLIYTSHPLHKIPLDAPIYEYLRSHFNSTLFMIILWSDKYLDSPACLNEMGAAWVTQSDYTNIYVPTFSFGNPKYHECAVDTKKMGAVLNGDAHCKANMIELKNKIESIFGLENDEARVTFLLDRFIDEIREDKPNG